MYGRVVRLLVWNAMVHERVHGFPWSEVEKTSKRMQSLAQNNEKTDQRERESMGEKDAEIMKRTGVKQQNNVKGMQDVEQQNVQLQRQSDITVDKGESFVEEKLDVSLERAEKLTERKRDDSGRKEKSDSGGNCCGGAGAQHTDRWAPGLRPARNGCCDNKAEQQSRHVNHKNIVVSYDASGEVADHAFEYTIVGEYTYLWYGVGISSAFVVFLGLVHAAAARKTPEVKPITTAVDMEWSPDIYHICPMALVAVAECVSLGLCMPRERHASDWYSEWLTKKTKIKQQPDYRCSKVVFSFFVLMNGVWNCIMIMILSFGKNEIEKIQVYHIISACYHTIFACFTCPFCDSCALHLWPELTRKAIDVAQALKTQDVTKIDSDGNRMGTQVIV